MAGLLIGFPGGGTVGRRRASPLYTSTSAWKYAGFVQDNWRATDKLTLNLGLRYDIEMPRTERYNRMNYIDLSAPHSPISVPGMTLAGAPMFTERATRVRSSIRTRTTFRSARRVRVSGITNSFVVRGGYGIFYLPERRHGAAGTGAGGFLGSSRDHSLWLSYDPV